MAKIEKLIESGTRSDAGYLLAPFLDNARGRMEAIRFDETHVLQENRERKEQETASIAAQVERETNLNEQEQGEYGEFLKKEYFTRGDFGRLSTFYSDGGAWDRLSDGGKSEMSHRVWEGIRHDEFRFEEMPEELRKKEADHLYQQLSGKIEEDPGLKNIPQHDRDDFVREHEAGNQKAVTEVLSRDAFTENVSSRSKSANLADLQDRVKEPDKHGNKEVENSISSLAKISPVQTVDEVTVPQVNAGANHASEQSKGSNTFVR